MTDSADTRTKRRVAVIGGGIVGLCLAEALTERKISFWCFEQGAVGGGQSGGVTRIFRHRHASPQLVALALEARSEWARLAERVGEELVGPEGVLILGGEGNEASRLKGLGVAVETPPWIAVRDRMPLGHIVDEGALGAIFETNGGAIRAHEAIARLFEAVGRSVLKTEVQGLAQDDSGVTVFASDGIYEVDEVFVTAGAGTARLARSDGIDIPERRACHLRLTFESRAADTLPCLLDRSSCFGESAYGSPTPDGRGYAIGISSEDGSVSTPDSKAPDPAQLLEIQARIEAYAKRLLPSTLGRVTGARLCLATPLKSGDDDFRAWRKGRVTYFAGHNLFKFAPLIGTLLAESSERRELPQALRRDLPTSD
jgi:sarcosine oxidase